jgi:N-acylglucosamine-6-phosphate 2-epimerase
LASRLDAPVIAEGWINTPEQAFHALELGAYAVVVGSAIT